MAAFLTVSVLMVELLLVSADLKIITAKPGENVTLPCRAPDSRTVKVVEWDRTGLESEFVFVFRDNHFDPHLQHSSFKDRVDLQDPEMKDGDVSLVLKNMMNDDAGTYKCRVETKGSRRKRSFDDPITTIQLQLEPGHQDGGQQGGQTGLVVTLGVLAVVLVLVLAVVPLIVKKRISLQSPPPDEEAEEPPLI